MDPITAINQEFVRLVVKDWSEHTEPRRSAHTSPSAHGIGAAVQTLIAWARGLFPQHQGRRDGIALTRIAK